MSDAMKEALELSALLFTIVLLTQVGRHRFEWIKTSLSSGFAGYLFWDTCDRTEATGPNATAALLGVALGALIGYAMMRKMTVCREGKKNKVYSRAGWAYLGIWFAVLIPRTCFLLALENWDWFSEEFGQFMVKVSLDDDGVAAFFVLLAATMVAYRVLVCLYRVRQLPPRDGGGAAAGRTQPVAAVRESGTAALEGR